MIVVTHRSFAAGLDALERAPSGLESSPSDQLTDPDLRAGFSDALEAIAAESLHEGVLVSPRHKLGSCLQSYALEHPPDGARLAGGGLEAKYDTRDIAGWVRSFFDWWGKLRPVKWREPPERAERIGDGTTLRVGLLADWGTGMYGAPVCARSMETDGEYDLLVHLGDVYYSGTEKEVKENFLPCWPTIDRAVNRALNSNHEMYSGGRGLFNVTLPAFGQKSSVCAAETDHWLVVGLDTGYDDHDLAHDQVDWLERLVGAAGDRRVILLSHHQPFSLLSGQGPRLVAKLDRLLGSGKVFAWYWGHEHRCVLYDRHPAWGMHGRCLGHGGMPYFRGDVSTYPAHDGDERWRRVPGRNLVPGGLLLDGPNQYVEGHADEYGPNGYMTLEIDGQSLSEFVHAPDGSVLRENQLA